MRVECRGVTFQIQVGEQHFEARFHYVVAHQPSSEIPVSVNVQTEQYGWQTCLAGDLDTVSGKLNLKHISRERPLVSGEVRVALGDVLAGWAEAFPAKPPTV